ncbi:hypothetical protein MJO28_005491 [Puccinia striiformis f. sp. tritici]|uniref:Uncharacterized protein n=1 Tax=Puccinia striiformis f. sp. tritici TaxID=168172 RepID=A0ACC0ENU9_9BASI|nr:hypothetical protein MJO28_005491 [Puccinia striiformis f. sp. tritici]
MDPFVHTPIPGWGWWTLERRTTRRFFKWLVKKGWLLYSIRPGALLQFLSIEANIIICGVACLPALDHRTLQLLPSPSEPRSSKLT